MSDINGGTANTIPERNNIPVEYKWASEDLYKSDSDWERDYEKVKEDAGKLIGYKGILSQSAQNLLSYLRDKDDLTVKYDRIFNYAERKTHEDTRNAHYQDYYNKAQILSSAINSFTAFSTPEILSIPDDVLVRFYEECSELQCYRHHIDEKRKRKAHILSEGEEKLLAQAQTISNSPTAIMATFTNADLKFPDIEDEHGKMVPMTLERYRAYTGNKSEKVRRNAFFSLHKVLGDYKNTSAAIYNAHVNQMLFNARARNYSSSIEYSLDNADVPLSVYTNLINAVKSNLHYMHKYVKLRKKLLKLDNQHIYDLSIPLVQNFECKVSYDEAKKDIVNALLPLGEEYQKVLKEGFENRWIDVYENEGKFGGAYSTGTYEHPYVLLNYKDSLMDEFILVHEMGHAIHSYFSNKYQPVVYSQYVNFVAEVASTCNEALLMEYLLNKSTDKMERANLINYFLEQFRGTFFRQAMLAEFEMRTHELVQQGTTLTADVLNSLYHQLNCEYFGDGVTVEQEIGVEWSKIPHLYYDFYVYQYATGYAAAMALSRRILEEGQPAVDRYISFLSGGCSDSPIELLKNAGIDMTTPEPVTEALQIFGKLIDELDSLLCD